MKTIIYIIFAIAEKSFITGGITMKVFKMTTSNKEVERSIRELLGSETTQEHIFISASDTNLLGKVLRQLIESNAYGEVAFSQEIQLNEVQKQIIEIMKGKAYITTKEMEEEILLSKQTTLKLLKELEQKGEIFRIKKRKWRYKDAPEEVKSVSMSDKVTRKQEKTREQILAFIKEKGIVKTAEFLKIVSVSYPTMCQVLVQLQKEGEVFKIQKGKWRYKDVPEEAKPINAGVEAARKQKKAKKQILAFIKEKGIVKTAEIVEIVSVSHSSMYRVLVQLQQEGEIFKIKSGIWRYKDAPEAVELVSTSGKVTRKQEKTREQILAFIKEKGIVKTAEIVEIVSVSYPTMCQVLAQLQKEGEVFKIQKGIWRYKDAPEAVKSVSTSGKVTRKQEKTREQILAFIKVKGIVKTTEIIEIVSVSYSTMYQVLEQLQKEGEVFKIQKGKWRYKNISILSVSQKQEMSKEAEVNKIFSKGWRVSVDELAQLCSISPKSVQEIVDKLFKEEVIERHEDGTISQIQKSNIFQKKEYKDILHYIMKQEYISKAILEYKFPTQAEEIIEMLEQEKWLRFLPGENRYKVLIFGKVLYFINENPNVKKMDIQRAFPRKDYAEVSRVIDAHLKAKRILNKDSGFVINL